MNPTLCRHCQKRHQAPRRRGLCWGCWDNPGIRSLYPSKPRSGFNKSHAPPLTEAEVEALIAEQMPTMPPSHGRVGPRLPDPLTRALTQRVWRT